MAAQTSPFNRLLMVLMFVLYLISLGAFSYANWNADPEQSLWNLVGSAVILSLPLLLFFGSSFVLISAWREHHLTGQVSARLAKVLRWAPRVAAMAIIFFVSLFSLDVFEMSVDPLQLLGAFIMHSLPSIFMILGLVVAWRRPVAGFIAFLLAGLFFMPFVIFDRSIGHFLLVSGPLLLIAGLFFADWRWNKPQPLGV